MKRIKNISIATIASILLLSYPVNCNTVTAEVSYGELIDKITILTIKSERITNKEKLKNVQTELETLQKAYDDYVGNRIDIPQLQDLLKKINEALWDIEDAIRIKERNKEFDDEFIAIARSVYTTNDERCAIKKKIDLLLGSHITEEKSYEEFAT
jgi:hypothetical protein